MFQSLVNFIILFTHKYDAFIVVGLILFIVKKKNVKHFVKLLKINRLTLLYLFQNFIVE